MYELCFVFINCALIPFLDSALWLMAEEALASLRQEISGQQGKPPTVAQDETPLDSLPPPPPIPSAPQASPYKLHGHSEIAPPIVAQATVIDDTHRAVLPAKFRMPDIERYTGIGCPHLHLRLYSTVMRAHGLDESQMITLTPLSLSGAAQRWFASLESSRRQTWGDLAREFLQQFSFNIVVDVSRRELEALRSNTDGLEEFTAQDRQACGRGTVRRFWVISYGFIRCRGRHLERIMDRFFPSDIKGKKPFVGPRPADVSAIGSSNQRPLRRHQSIPQFPEPHSSYASHQYKPRAPRLAYDQTYTPQTLALPYYASQGIERPSVSYTATGQPCYAAQFTARPAAPYPRLRAQQTSTPFALRT
ncbi:hypothetical protein CK203_026657 [Vitis vinifera]|uniref:Retrotransposon gag domain-containing protein n=1 Tax=Vitis vinifera TaxID=29760 RepID=A0A438IU39_VITVI|nr:hypothetical protein CK203_026657 [Vitis vinifera]